MSFFLFECGIRSRAKDIHAYSEGRCRSPEEYGLTILKVVGDLQSPYKLALCLTIRPQGGRQESSASRACRGLGSVIGDDAVNVVEASEHIQNDIKFIKEKLDLKQHK